MISLICTAILLICCCSFMPGNKTNFPNRPISVDPRNPLKVDTIAPAGRKIFVQYCSLCHKDSTISLAPDRYILSAMTPRSIFGALTTGKMRTQGASLNPDDKKAVAEWLTQTVIKTNNLPKEAYSSFSISPKRSDYSGWGGNKEATGYRPSAASGIDTNNVSSLKLKWA